MTHAGRPWDSYGEQAGSPLLTRSGLLSMGPANSAVIAGIRRSAELHQVRIQQLNADEIHNTYPALAPVEEHVGIFDPGAGWIDVDRALSFALTQAHAAGCGGRIPKGAAA